MSKAYVTVLITAILAACSSAVNAQPVKCRACDCKTVKGVPYASIASKDGRRGCSADSAGFFFASLTDTVRITSIGYKSKNTAISTISPNANGLRVVCLDEELAQTDEVVINGRKSGKRDLIKLASYSKKREKGVLHGQPGCQLAVRMVNTQNRAGLIEEISFKFEMENKKQLANLRLRVYNVNMRDKNLPGNDLLLDNVILTPKNGWVSVNVSKYSIPFPKNGAYIGLEWIESNIISPIGQRVEPGICYAFDKSCASSVECFRQHGWKPDFFAEDIGQGCMMLKMKVSFNR
ncbi:hypothetical protein [uncultured Acetobacteroides sp.]|uniref:hypothetical protein n=1 Tax=uncultured Acetobacteroides sp. TaxID=1760811 RepID=UPI0029F4C53A|nr:hypothetical protein [uncultured Acetobacteroides sp.]